MLAASAALVPLACASTVSHDFVLTRQNEEIHAVANDDMILEAFIEANHPATSENRSIELYGGDLSMYEFDVSGLIGHRSVPAGRHLTWWPPALRTYWLTTLLALHRKTNGKP